MIDSHVHIDFDGFENNVLDYKVHSKDIGLEFTVTNHIMVSDCIPSGYKIRDDNVFLGDYSFLKCSLTSENTQRYIDVLKRHNVLAGVEMDYVKGGKSLLENFLDSYPFDLVLGSVHFVDGFNVARNEDMIKYVQKKDIQEIYHNYFDNLASAIKSDLFDVMAHLDIIRKYSQRLKFKDYREDVENIVNLLAEHDTGLEVNTSGVAFTGESFPTIEVLHMCKEKGIDKITLGSDAHHLRHLGQNLGEGIEKLKRAGYKRVVKFKNRKPEFIDL